jgi:tetratricopeptide (TPR) repeat protein
VPLSERIDAIEKARTIAERRNLPELLWIADSSMGLLYEMAGRYGEVLELARRELGMVDQLDSRNQKCDAVRRAAVATMNIAGRYEEGLELARRSLELSRDTNPHQLMHGTFPVMEALYELGRWGEVSTILDEHLQAFKQDPAVECQFVRDGPILGAVLAARTGRLDRARELGRLVDDPLSNLEDASAWQARLAVVLGEPENGRLISGGKVQQQTRYAPDHARSLLEALIALEDWDELEKLIPVARARVPGLAVLGPCCDRAEGVLARARDDRAGSTAALEKAVAGFEALGARTETDATRQIIAASAVGA